MKDVSNGGSFLILRFTERRKERETWEEKKSFGTSFSFLLSVLLSSSDLEPFVGGKGKFLERNPNFLSSNQPVPSTLFFCWRRRGQQGEGGKKKQMETWVRETLRKRGLETAVGEVS